jgi:endoglucanase
VHVVARPAAALSGLQVSGNRITDALGNPLMLRGVNRSGTEYACAELGTPGNVGWGIFDGPSDAASVVAMRSWGVNYARVLLNEDCWLGINGINAVYGGSSYRTAITDYVDLLNANGIYVELSLIFAAPGTNVAGTQPAAPDFDHSIALWTSVATVFKSNPDVFFGVFGEPVVSWTCWLNGCSNEAVFSGSLYKTSGSQSLVTAIRGAGATQPISVPGIDYANDLSQWLAFEPADPLHSLVAEAHVYGNNTCGALDGGTCLTSTVAPVAAHVPVVFGETGETYDDSECGDANMKVILPWADAHNVGYAAWTWDTWGVCEALISAYDGTPNTVDPAGAAYGAYVRGHLLAVAPSRSVVTAPGGPAPGSRAVLPEAGTSPSVTRTALIGVSRSPRGPAAVTRRGDGGRLAPGFYRAVVPE